MSNVLKRILVALLVAAVGAGAFAAKPKARAKAVNTQQLADEAEEALLLYDADRLDEIIEKWQDALKKNQDVPAKLEQLQNRSIALRNMLARVEKVVIVDSIAVDTASFFSRYRLSPDAGTIAGTGMLTSFTPASGAEVFFVQKDSDNVAQIMHAGILDDGTREDATRLDLSVDPGSNTLFPFMLADGMTLYFANDADNENSLGGYDIYMTRRDDDGSYYEPTNVGMPFNSPGNDYMMAIDEGTGLGWWATDRNAEDGMVTIYVFVPNDTRVNYDPDNEDIANLAFITSVAATRPEDFDAKARLAVLDKLDSGKPSGGRSDSGFMFSLGNGKVYTSLAQFRNPQARDAMEEFLEMERSLSEMDDELSALRALYRKGDESKAGEILQLEKQRENVKRNSLPNLRNKVIRLESAR